MWADVILTGVLGCFDALRVSPSKPVVRLSKRHLQMLGSTCPGSAPARAQLVVRPQGSAHVRREPERLSTTLDDPNSLGLWVANLRKRSDTFVTYSMNLKTG